jgi:hypothetical protein
MKNFIKSVALSVAAVALASTMSASSRAAQPISVTDAKQNRAIIARGLQAWADGTGSPYDLLAPDVSWTITGNSKGSRTYPTK